MNPFGNLAAQNARKAQLVWLPKVSTPEALIQACAQMSPGMLSEFAVGVLGTIPLDPHGDNILSRQGASAYLFARCIREHVRVNGYNRESPDRYHRDIFRVLCTLASAGEFDKLNATIRVLQQDTTTSAVEQASLGSPDLIADMLDHKRSGNLQEYINYRTSLAGLVGEQADVLKCYEYLCGQLANA